MGFVGFRFLKPGTDKDLFATYFEVYPIPMSAPLDPGLQHWLSGVAQYNQQHFEAAATEFQISRRMHEMPDFMADFYAGQAFLASGQPDSAISCFGRVLQVRNDIHPLSRWYLALGHLAAEEEEKARYHLQIIFEEGGYRSRDAGMILEKL